MFGSNDDKKNPAAAGEKKGLFGWLRRKPQETVVEQPAPAPEITPEPLIEAAPVVVEAAPEVVVVAAEPVVEVAPEPAPWPHLPVAEEPVARWRMCKRRISCRQSPSLWLKCLRWSRLL